MTLNVFITNIFDKFALIFPIWEFLKWLTAKRCTRDVCKSVLLRFSGVCGCRHRSALSDYCISIRAKYRQNMGKTPKNGNNVSRNRQPGYRALCSEYRGDSLNKTATASLLLFRSLPIPLSRYFSSLQREAQSSWIRFFPQPPSARTDSLMRGNHNAMRFNIGRP